MKNSIGCDTFPYSKFICDLPLSFDINVLPKAPFFREKNQYKKWYYGDNVELKIRLLPEKVNEYGMPINYTEQDLEKFRDKSIIATLYNFHFEPVISNEFFFNNIDIDTATIIFNIDSDTSTRLFPKGVYYLGVKINYLLDTTYFDDTAVINSNLLVRKQYFVPDSSETQYLDDSILNYFTHNVDMTGEDDEKGKNTIISPQQFLIDVR